jgi:hypothetical protein
MRAEPTRGRNHCRRHFIIIGAMKAGTTSLFRFLTSHPEISGSATKELHYFSLHGARFGRTGYDLSFVGLSGPLLGEASPSYSEYPRFGDTARRIRVALPDVKLIYCVRDPIDRMTSHFTHEVLEGRQVASATDGAWTNEYLAPSLYGYQLERYLRYFDPSSLAIVDTEFLRTDRAAALERLYRFLGVSPRWTGGSDLADEYVSDERAPVSPTFAPLKRSASVRRLARLVPSSVRSAARSAISVHGTEADGGSPGDRVRVPPVPAHFLEQLHDDRRLFLPIAESCQLIGDRPPAEWWSLPDAHDAVSDRAVDLSLHD